MQSVSPKEFHEALAHPDEAVAFIDVRTPEEYCEAHISGVTNIPIDDLDQHIAELAKKDKVYVHCKRGGRGSKACSILQEYHLSNVYNLDGGIEEWENQGYEISHTCDV